MKDRVVGVVSPAIHPPFFPTFPSSFPVAVIPLQSRCLFFSCFFLFLLIRSCFTVPVSVAFSGLSRPNGPFWKPALPEIGDITPVAPFAEA